MGKTIPLKVIPMFYVQDINIFLRFCKIKSIN